MPATCIEHSVREAAAAFVRQIGNLSDEPEVRDSLLKTAVHEVAWRLLGEFRDHYRLAEQLAIMSQLAWLGTEAVQASRIALPATRILRTASAGWTTTERCWRPVAPGHPHRDRHSSPTGPWPS